MRRNACYSNGNSPATGAGIQVRCGSNFVIDNHVTRNDVGIEAFSNGDEVVVRNTSDENLVANYATGTGNDFGAVVNHPASAGPWSNLSN